MFDYQINPILVSLLTFFLGLLVGNWQAIGRDKRREFNEIAIPIRRKILDEASDPSPMRCAVSSHDADAISTRLSRSRGYAFLKRCDEYWEARNKHDNDELGQPFYADKEPVRKAANNLVKYVSIR